MPRSAEAATPGIEASPALFEKLRPGPGRSAAEVAGHQRARIHSAMVQIVGERGYEAVTARELAQLSAVSTRAFYQHFASKEECFLRTHELVVRRTVRSVIVAHAGGRDLQERLRFAFNAFVDEVARDPNAGRLVLLEAYSAGPEALDRARRTQCTFEAMLAESLSGASEEIGVPQLVIEGIVAGVESVARARLIPGRERELAQLGDPLTEWALSYRSEVAASLGDLDCRSVAEPPASASTPVHSSSTREKEVESRSPTGDRGLLLSAVAKLAAARGYEELTPARIRAVAGVSRRSFEANFKGVEDCFLAALEWREREAIERAAQAATVEHSWADGVHMAIVNLCRQIASDPVLANLCFAQAFAPSGGMRHRERPTADLIALLRDVSPSDERTADLFAEASAGAIWGVIHHHVVSGRSQQPTHSRNALLSGTGAGCRSRAGSGRNRRRDRWES